MRRAKGLSGGDKIEGRLLVPYGRERIEEREGREGNLRVERIRILKFQCEKKKTPFFVLVVQEGVTSTGSVRGEIRPAKEKDRKKREQNRSPLKGIRIQKSGERYQSLMARCENAPRS